MYIITRQVNHESVGEENSSVDGFLSLEKLPSRHEVCNNYVLVYMQSHYGHHTHTTVHVNAVYVNLSTVARLYIHTIFNMRIFHTRSMYFYSTVQSVCMRTVERLRFLPPRLGLLAVV